MAKGPNHKRIYLSAPHMGGTELNYIHEAFEQNWISPVGPNITGFEKALADYSGVPHVAALSSGTAAIHLALILLGVGEGDEVLCSSFTFSGSANPIIYQKATPVFIDSELETWNIDPLLLEKAIKDRIHKGKKPKAILLVHLYGMPAKLDELIAIANAYEIPIIEDAAEALGATYKGQRLGSFGEIGIFSFNGNKIITTSGGGALVSNHLEYVEKAKFLATQARDPEVHYQHSEIGYNYRMSNISAGIGRGQMEVIDRRVEQKRKIFEYYRNALASTEHITFIEELPNLKSNQWLTTIVTKSFDQRESIRLALEKENIESRPLWKPMHLQPVFQKYPYYGDGTSEALFNVGLCLPSGTDLLESDLSRICSIIKSVCNS